MRVGVDVGGTHTDAVLMDGADVIVAIKKATTPDVSSGIILGVSDLLAETGAAPGDLDGVMIGTTQFTNAFVERRRLVEVAVIRISLPANASIPPMVDWPEDLIAAVGENSYMVRGGYEYDGREFEPLDEAAVVAAALDIRRKGIVNIAISCTFSATNAGMEARAAALVRSLIPDAGITLSSEIGRLGLIERENAAIMNAALSALSVHVVGSFRHALKSLQIAAPFFISQNDGTLMSADQVERFPVLTFASGPTNSMRGAAQLSGRAEAVVIDIGGTTTDIGVLAQGFPRESSVATDVGGVRTNFRMPDILALGLGGGSVVRRQADGRVTIGPDSVGFDLDKRARVFGGDTITATDIAVAAGCAQIGDPAAVADLEPAFVEAALSQIHRMIEDGVDRMKTSAAPLPVVLVGGGAVLVDRPLSGASEVVVPAHSGVANAIGAAMAQVAGECDRLFAYASLGRDEALRQAEAEARARAVAAGALADSVSLVEVEETPLAYMPGGAVRIRMKAVGDLRLPARVRAAAPAERGGAA
jgi:N-methylhydantoinase A/oxoprolinase/acetone carboxylase beta subunit